MEDYKQCLGIVLMFSVVSLVLSVNAANLEYQGYTQAWFISNVPTIRGLCICYSTFNRGAEYCDEHVCTYMCVCVCLSVCDTIFGTTRPIFTRFFVHITYGCGSVLLWWRFDTLCTSSFMDDLYLLISQGCSMSPPS